MKRIAFIDPETGILALVNPVVPRIGDETDEAYYARVAAHDVPEGTEWEVVDLPAALENDRNYRLAWVVGATKKVKVDTALKTVIDAERAAGREGNLWEAVSVQAKARL